MKLIPATRTIDADWRQIDLCCRRWALVGKSSGNIHCMFDALNAEEATKILEAYNKIRAEFDRGDSGHELYEVPRKG